MYTAVPFAIVEGCRLFMFLLRTLRSSVRNASTYTKITLIRNSLGSITSVVIFCKYRGS